MQEKLENFIFNFIFAKHSEAHAPKNGIQNFIGLSTIAYSNVLIEDRKKINHKMI